MQRVQLAGDLVDSDPQSLVALIPTLDQALVAS